MERRALIVLMENNDATGGVCYGSIFITIRPTPPSVSDHQGRDDV